MLEPIYLNSADWLSVFTTSFKILKEREDGIIFQTSLSIWRGDIPELDLIYSYPQYGFYFSSQSNGSFFGACLGKTYYSQSPLSDPRSFLGEVKLRFPEYGQHLEKNYKSFFPSLIPI